MKQFHPDANGVFGHTIGVYANSADPTILSMFHVTMRKAPSLPDGTQFAGVEGLRTYMADHKEDFVRTLGSKLLTYAIGRGIEHYDQPAIRKIARDAAKNDYRWSSVILGVVTSTPFRASAAEARSEP